MAIRQYAQAVDKSAPSVAADKYIVRLPDGMRDRLKDAAAANNRTLNAEIVARLESTFSPQRELFSQAEMKAAIEALQGDVKAIRSNLGRDRKPRK